MPQNFTNKVFFKKATPSRHSRHGHQTRGYDSLNSSFQNIAAHLERLSTNASYNFETMIGYSKGPTICISKLTQITPPTINSWISLVRTLFDMNKYTAEQAKNVLKVVVDEQYHHVFIEKKSIETMLDAIIGHAFPTKDFNKYESILRTINVKTLRLSVNTTQPFKRMLTTQTCV
jgi:hypothetical protein